MVSELFPLSLFLRVNLLQKKNNQTTKNPKQVLQPCVVVLILALKCLCPRPICSSASLLSC